jgi:Histidine kinase-, DNA gyrase B-, and HSP90-like ATPase
VKTNIQGLVKSLDLKQTQGMMPLFEAISNAMDAIAETGKGLNAGNIHIHLIRLTDLGSKPDELPLINSLTVTDDGIGFTDDNLKSFEEAYTQAKVKLGGKGVGRFTYLKVFKKIQVDSNFRDSTGRINSRKFNFSIDNEVSDIANFVAPNGAKTGTVISLADLDPSYFTAWPRDPQVVAQRVVSHFLIRFAGRSAPAIQLHDSGIAPIELLKVFDDTVLPNIQAVDFNVGQHHFHLQVLRQKGSRDAHEISYCARAREVFQGNLKKLLPELPQTFLETDTTHYTLKVLVTGEYLDAHANTARTGILFNPDNDDLATDESLITQKELDAEIIKTLRTLLVDDLRVTNQEKLDGIEHFIASDAPEYRVLLSDQYREMIEREVPAGATGDKLDEALLRVKRKIEDRIRIEGSEIKVLVDSESFEKYEQKMNEHIARINDMGKSQLASYVAHRRSILDLLDLSLKKSRTDAKYRLEEVLHNMIFPMRNTSKDMFFEQQNLWVIDERLCYHTILTSDKKLNSVAGLENTHRKEPDIFGFFYDAPTAVREPDDGSGAVVIIEFKRPGRDDYSSDPAQQVLDHFVAIADGKVRDIDGRVVNPSNIRYYGYFVADLTPTLKRQMRFNYQQSVDGEGYFRTLPGGNGYVEIISYDKLLRDAQRRNRILFEKLGLHKR